VVGIGSDAFGTAVATTGITGSAASTCVVLVGAATIFSVVVVVGSVNFFVSALTGTETRATGATGVAGVAGVGGSVRTFFFSSGFSSTFFFSTTGVSVRTFLASFVSPFLASLSVVVANVFEVSFLASATFLFESSSAVTSLRA
tara:strand:- start:556 stop:987 length:432 start_codon:yes stop_codon:yes gene_type:complete